MTEIFFVLTVIYAAYVIFSVVNDNKKEKVIDDSAPALMSVTANINPLIPEKAMAQPLVKPVTKAAKPAVVKSGLKNPATGEIATSYANYRFMKRWIKEALVSEGLLEKIYKNNELNEEVEVKIKEAVALLESNDGYRI
ncbi:MAG: hypothetical protein WCL34_09030 [Methylococcaceae bacterium]|jgi:hypothetical protein